MMFKYYVAKILAFLLIFMFYFTEINGQKRPLSGTQLTRLSNGLSVLVIEDDSNPLVHFDLIFRFGAISENETTNGLAHLYEHMMFTATTSFPKTELYQNQLAAYGIESNALTNEESVHYYFSLNSFNWKEGLEVFVEGIKNPLFLERELQLQKSAIRDELNIFRSDPYYLIGQATLKTLWGEENSRKDISGNLDIINEASTALLKDVQRQHHTPNQALLIVAGDLKKEAALSQIKRVFGDWGNQRPGVIPETEYQYTRLSDNQYVLLEHGSVEIPGLQIAWQGPGVDDLDGQVAAALFLYMLNLTASDFHQDLDEKDYVYDYFAGIRFGSRSSTLFFEFYPDVKTIDESIQWLDKQIAAWLEGDQMSIELLSLAKRKWEIESIFEQEKLSEYILELGDKWAIGDKALSLEFQDRIQAITQEDMKKLVRNYLNQPRVYGLIVPANKSKRLHKSIRNKFLSQ